MLLPGCKSWGTEVTMARILVDKYDGHVEAKLKEFCFRHHVKIEERYTTQSGNAKVATKRAKVSKPNGEIVRLVYDTSRRVWYNS